MSDENTEPDTGYEFKPSEVSVAAEPPNYRGWYLFGSIVAVGGFLYLYWVEKDIPFAIFHGILGGMLAAALVIKEYSKSDNFSLMDAGNLIQGSGIFGLVILLATTLYEYSSSQQALQNIETIIESFSHGLLAVGVGTICAVVAAYLDKDEERPQTQVSAVGAPTLGGDTSVKTEIEALQLQLSALEQAVDVAAERLNLFNESTGKANDAMEGAATTAGQATQHLENIASLTTTLERFFEDPPGTKDRSKVSGRSLSS